ncbi:hypothetical protein NEHOM01_1405 [Nematocida homosporus]|uniref:uncharacterized protein n=1 Tax=Nematocida homosporus TaxID=1912981 RepID=UPI0022200575|nr:uncharacterized protein NEHOM01_1405 [Nematocida homosporus]KAI5186341.1 hypothetical protein NEHOM01_1405 [Nematocida homosporus]
MRLPLLYGVICLLAISCNIWAVQREEHDRPTVGPSTNIELASMGMEPPAHSQPQLETNGRESDSLSQFSLPEFSTYILMADIKLDQVQTVLENLNQQTQIEQPIKPEEVQQLLDALNIFYKPREHLTDQGKLIPGTDARKNQTHEINNLLLPFTAQNILRLLYLNSALFPNTSTLVEKKELFYNSLQIWMTQHVESDITHLRHFLSYLHWLWQVASLCPEHCTTKVNPSLIQFTKPEIIDAMDLIKTLASSLHPISLVCSMYDTTIDVVKTHRSNDVNPYSLELAANDIGISDTTSFIDLESAPGASYSKLRQLCEVSKQPDLTIILLNHSAIDPAHLIKRQLGYLIPNTTITLVLNNQKLTPFDSTAKARLFDTRESPVMAGSKILDGFISADERRLSKLAWIGGVYVTATLNYIISIALLCAGISIISAILIIPTAMAFFLFPEFRHATLAHILLSIGFVAMFVINGVVIAAAAKEIAASKEVVIYWAILVPIVIMAAVSSISSRQAGVRIRPTTQTLLFCIQALVSIAAIFILLISPNNLGQTLHNYHMIFFLALSLYFLSAIKVRSHYTPKRARFFSQLNLAVFAVAAISILSLVVIAGINGYFNNYANQIGALLKQDP